MMNAYTGARFEGSVFKAVCVASCDGSEELGIIPDNHDGTCTRHKQPSASIIEY